MTTVIAFEGPSYGGKTTAIGHLRHTLNPNSVMFCDCYVRSIPRHQGIPRPSTRSADEQLRAFETFMRIEEARVTRLARRPETRLAILDRSVDTLLAHAHALDAMYGYGVLDLARQRLNALPHLRPDHTLYLDASAEVVGLRRKEAGHAAVEPEYFLHDAQFLHHTRAYFCTPSQAATASVAAEVTVVPGDGPRYDIARAVEALVRFWAPS
ncbi:hypothetical protein ACIA78_34900 [Streptomyces xanthochromogenes]|uniref:hypothetical protein n=1 Tax=Streptomyces xanthochromogenes TaxID=67384 RepID=UPI0037BA61EA